MINSDNKPIATIVAGANATGKTTLVSTLYQTGFFDKEEYVSPDLIVYRDLGCNEENEKEVYVKAFALADEQRNRIVGEKNGFVLETDLSGDTELELFQELKEHGYRVRLIYVGTDTIETNARYLIRRIKERGHDVPLKKLMQRASDAIYNLSKIWDSDGCDEVILIDNSTPDQPPEVFMHKVGSFKAMHLKPDEEVAAWSRQLFYWITDEPEPLSDEDTQVATAIDQKITQSIQRCFSQTCELPIRWVYQQIEEELSPGAVKAMMIYSSNTGIFDGYGNRAGKLYLGNYAQWYGPFGRDDTFHTSSIVSFEKQENILTLNTLNSVYVFEILKGEIDLSLIEPAPQELVELHLQQNSQKHSIYWCQVHACGFLEGLIDPVKMPYPMDKQEAIEYVSLGRAVSYDGHIAKIVLNPMKSS